MDPYSKSIQVIHEDREVIRELVDVLGTHGCRVEPVASARAAYERLIAAPLRPRMIVLDWAIADRERFAFLELKASNGRLAPIPVLVLADLVMLRSIPSLGVRALLAMPLRPHMIADAVVALSGLTAPLPAAASIGASYAISVSDGGRMRSMRTGADVDDAGGRLRLPTPGTTPEEP
jgi:CheY-like chemotaxis protein